MKRLRRSWILIAFALAALLATIAVFAHDVIVQTRLLRENLQLTEARSRERERALRDVQDETAALAIALRDALIDPREVTASTRGQLEDLHRSVMAGLARLREQPDATQDKWVRQLSELHERYWRLAGTALSWRESELRAKRAAFLRTELAPLREAAMESARNIQLMEETLNREHRARTEAAFERLDAALSRTLAVSLFIGFVISLWTVWRLSRLERQADSLQRQTELDKQQFRILSRTLVQAQEEERRSLSRELHDQIGQMLTAIQMVFTNIEREYGDPRRHIEDGKALTERTVAEVRNISMGLRPSLLDDLGLGPAIQWQAREFSKRSGVPADLKLDDHLEMLSDSQKTCLYRVVQELLTNCARHAQAKRVRIELRAGEEAVSLMVEDDGKGFDLASPRQRGLGLFGMEERVRELGGEVSIFTRPGMGTQVRIVVPANLQEAI
jgi:signal transduction histidine kinase